MTHRLLALLGVIAHAIRRVLASILSLIGLGVLARFAVPALIAAFAALAVLSGLETARILDSRPEITQSTLTEVAAHEGEGSVWFEFDALIDSSTLATPADLGTFFYVARDPDDPGQGLLLRSPVSDRFFRVRVVQGVLTGDPDLVADALARFGTLPAGLEVDQARYLDETGTGAPADEAVEPSDLRGMEAGIEGPVAGRVISPSTLALCETDGACDGADAAWLYLFADAHGGSATVLRSPHPPDAIPVRLQGLFLHDSYDLAPVLASPWYAEIDAEVPTDRAFAAGSQPPITVPASWVPTIIFTILALLLLASQLVGYPVFARGADPAPRRTLSPGDRVPVVLTGRLANGRTHVELDRSPGAVERLPVAELAMLMWRYGMSGELSRREAEERFTREAGAPDRLVINERDQSAIVLVERGPGGATAQTGELYRVARSSPAVRFRQGASDAFLTLRSAEDRDRIAAEIAAEAAGTT
ncbi:MAG: hypothetical protein ACXWWQ_06075 [Candidatus Limnocylindria bacterium]